MVKVGIIGGSGLDNPEILEGGVDVNVDTKYGKPSSPLKLGKISGVDVVLLARHGRNHEIPPSQVNFRANIMALKEAGCDFILATSAVGSLREKIDRGDLVIVDQFIDFTRHRKVSFFESFADGPKHTPMAKPFSSQLRTILINSCVELGLSHHKKGTVVTIEGPRFSTKAESHMFRSWGADIINMSIAPESILANELGIPYAAVAMSTDYDCWKEDEEPVSWDEILKVFGENIGKVTKLLIKTIPKLCRSSSIEIIKSKIRTYPHWPKQGVMFRDINSLLNDEEGFSLMIEELMDRYKAMDIDVIVGIESRGFITGSILAHKLGKKFVLVRKKGKLPGEIIGQEFNLEYGADEIEIQKGVISPGEKVLLVDDLVATAGTCLAACKLIKQMQAEVIECSFVIELPELQGRKKIEDLGYKVFSLLQIEGE